MTSATRVPPGDTGPVRAAAPVGNGGRRSRKERRAARPRWRRVLGRLFLLAVILGIAGLIGVGYVLAQVELPEVAPPVETSFILDAGGNKLAELSNGENRVSKDLEEMSPTLIDAVLSSEDRDFFSHNGIDVVAIGRALFADLRGKPLQGGSTITQQYVKVTYTDRARTLARKLEEATLAVKLEQRFDKEEILERYLNTVYFGRGAYGAQAASQAYFQVNVDQLDINQAAYLAGLLRAPEMADARRDGYPQQAEEADRRRNLVLRAMEEEGHITDEQVEFLASAPVSSYVTRERSEVVRDRIIGSAAGTEYFLEYVKKQMRDRYGEERLTGGGLQIHTTLDLELQLLAHDAVRTILDQEGDPDAAVVSLDTEGQVKAMVGGKDFASNNFNYAAAVESGGTGRQPGSTFKPFILAELVRQGYSVDSMIDSPGTKVFPKGNNGVDYEPSNYGGSGHGRVSIAKATEVSSNTAYVAMALELGLERVAATAKELGIRTEPPLELAMALGAGEVSVLDMADAYLTFATRGLQVDPRVVTRVTNADGEVIDEFPAQKTRVLEENQADVINDVLQGVVRSGTGRDAAIDHPLAGKTGTTSNNVDAWFVGYTPGISTAVWVGFGADSSREMSTRPTPRTPPQPPFRMNVTGGTLPADIFQRYMSRAVTDERYSGEFVEPASRAGRPFGGRANAPTTAPPATRPPATSPPATQPPASTTSTTDRTSTTTTRPGRPGGPGTSTTLPGGTTSTTLPEGPPITIPGPGGPGGGGGGVGGGGLPGGGSGGEETLALIAEALGLGGG